MSKELINHFEGDRFNVESKLYQRDKERSLSFTTWQKQSGSHWVSGKAYCHWQDGPFASFYQTKSGKMVARTRVKKKWVYHNISSRGDIQHALRIFTAHRDHIAEMADAVIERFGQPIPINTIAPLLREVVGSIKADAAYLRAFEGATDIKEVVLRLFGKRAYRKPLVRSFAQATPLRRYIAWCLRGGIPPEWLIDFMRAGEDDWLLDVYSFPLHRLRIFVRSLDATSKRRLLRQSFTRQSRNLRLILDLNKVKTDISPTQARSWEDLHDQVFAEERARMTAQAEAQNRKLTRGRAERDAKLAEHSANPNWRDGLTPSEVTHWERLLLAANNERTVLERRVREQAEAEERQRQRDIEQAKKFAEVREEMSAIAGTMTKGGLRLDWATSRETTLEWGNKMRNCIASYSTDDRGLFGIHRDDELVACMEVQQGPVLAQLLGKFNEPLPEEERTDIEAHLSDLGVEVPVYYWGRD